MKLIRFSRACQEMFILGMGDHQCTGGLKLLQTCAAIMYLPTDEERNKRRAAIGKVAFKTEIRARKKACLENLCYNSNTNTWGDAYRVVVVIHEV